MGLEKPLEFDGVGMTKLGRGLMWLISLASLTVALGLFLVSLEDRLAVWPAVAALVLFAVTNPLIAKRIRFLDKPWKTFAAAALCVGVFMLFLSLPGGRVAQVSSGYTASSAAVTHVADARAFKDCNKCAEMIPIKAGTLMMGAAAGETGVSSDGKSVAAFDDELPQHMVNIKSFAAGRFEVTFDDWDYCASSGGCQSNKRPDDNGLGRGTRPVINVSWNDAQEYVSWLSEKTGKRYRLLSEAEWEYAARGGTTTAYFWGNDVGKDDLYCACRDSHEETKPVGSFRPNAFGLYDTAGNVAELVQDVGHSYVHDAPTDGSAWMDENYARHMAEDNSLTAVKRGGSIESSPIALRSASREFTNRAGRFSNTGFRLARDLP